MPEYESIIAKTRDGLIGARTATIDPTGLEPIWNEQFANANLLVLDRIENYHRIYKWS